MCTYIRVRSLGASSKRSPWFTWAVSSPSALPVFVCVCVRACVYVRVCVFVCVCVYTV